MSGFKQRLYLGLPHPLQNLLVTLFDLQYYRRRAGRYKQHKRSHARLYEAAREVQVQEQSRRLVELVDFAQRTSPFYAKLYDGIDLAAVRSAADLPRLPMVSKEDVRINIDKIATLSPSKSYVAHTGGTTGKSLEIYYTWPDFQERQAVLDFFRERFGWKLGTRTAWFSGKQLLTPHDELRHRYWKTDLWFNIRYYSTFNMSNESMGYYVDDLNRWKPEFFSGFPSSIYELAAYIQRSAKPLQCKPRAIFTTSETLLPQQTRVIEEVFQTKVVDQYSSSEGAPFVIQCEHGSWHLLPWTGIIELLDEKGNAGADEGEVCITYFHSHGTPLIRYRLGDYMRVADPHYRCACGCECPVVERIEGRAIDFLYSRERGRINVVNVANSVKYTPGIVQMQAVQQAVDKITVSMVVNPAVHSHAERQQLLKELRDRLGEKIEIALVTADALPREQNGKYRLVKNLVRDLCQ
jgi:phenylacetate-CoA ligase